MLSALKWLVIAAVALLVVHVLPHVSHQQLAAGGSSMAVPLVMLGFVKNKVTLAAGAANANVLGGSVYEFATEPVRVEIGMLASAIGLTAAVTVGKDTLLEDGSAVDVVSIANKGPVYPDDFTLNDVALPPDRIRIAVKNPTAGAVDFFYTLKTTPIDLGQ